MREGRHRDACAEDDHVDAVADGRFGKDDFVYHASSDSYRCPAGETLTHHCTLVENGMRIRVYWASGCGTCAMRTGCTTGKERRVRRWEHEHVLDAMEERLARRPELMQVRRSTVEHVFGTIKNWMGATHFLTRGLANVGTEIRLQVLAYNLKRVNKRRRYRTTDRRDEGRLSRIRPPPSTGPAEPRSRRPMCTLTSQ